MSDHPPGSDEDYRAKRDFIAHKLQRLRAREGAVSFDHTYECMGTRVVTHFWHDGVDRQPSIPVTAKSYFGWAYHRFGRAPTTIWMHVPAEGEASEPRFEFDRPPEAAELRDVSLYVVELERRPRPAELVPGWMKVELAAVGAWDLRADAPTWADGEPTGRPQTPGSVGVPPPPGAEWAR